MANESSEAANSVKTRPFHIVKCWPHHHDSEELLQIELAEKLVEKLDADRAPLVHIYNGIRKIWRPINTESAKLRSWRYQIDEHILCTKRILYRLQQALDDLNSQQHVNQTPNPRPYPCFLHGKKLNMAMERKKFKEIARSRGRRK